MPRLNIPIMGSHTLSSTFSQGSSRDVLLLHFFLTTHWTLSSRDFTIPFAPTKLGLWELVLMTLGSHLLDWSTCYLSPRCTRNATYLQALVWNQLNVCLSLCACSFQKCMTPSKMAQEKPPWMGWIQGCSFRQTARILSGSPSWFPGVGGPP